MLDIIAQAGVFIFGLIAIVLVAKKNKWGFVFGLLSQPFGFLHHSLTSNGAYSF